MLLVLFVPVARAKQYAVELGKGQAALDHKDYTAAIEHLQKYTAEKPDDEIGHALLGASYQHARRADEAVHEYARRLALNPNDPYIQINLAELYVFQKQPAKAIPLFRNSIHSYQDEAQAHYFYGEALKLTGDLARLKMSCGRHYR